MDYINWVNKGNVTVANESALLNLTAAKVPDSNTPVLVKDEGLFHCVDVANINNTDSWKRVSEELEITESGNIHNVPVSCGKIVVNNTVNSTVFTGFKAPDYGCSMIIIEASGDHPISFQNQSNNSDENNRLSLPANLSSIDIKIGGKVFLFYSDIDQRWKLYNEWGSGLMLSLIDETATEDYAVTVTPEGFLQRVEILELTVANEAKTDEYDLDGLNADYPDMPKYHFVYCPNISSSPILYMKSKLSPSEWVSFAGKEVTNPI